MSSDHPIDLTMRRAIQLHYASSGFFIFIGEAEPLANMGAEEFFGMASRFAMEAGEQAEDAPPERLAIFEQARSVLEAETRRRLESNEGLPPACGTCQGVGRDARDEGGRCQDCGGNGMAPGLVGIHPKAAAMRARVERTMELRKQRFGHHPPSCGGMRSGVCTCPAKPDQIVPRHAPGCATRTGAGACDCESYKP